MARPKCFDRRRRASPRPYHRRGFPITDGAAGLARALTTLWPDVPTQRCAVRKHRNLLARAPDALHGAVSAGHIDVIDAATPKEGEAKR